MTIVVTGEMQDKFMILWRIWKGFTSAEIGISDLATKFSACVSHLNSLNTENIYREQTTQMGDIRSDIVCKEDDEKREKIEHFC